ncbi:MAG: carboxylating nicotinate-nucleotide diphosphorylase [Desulfobacteraceae bacterium]|nr:carboxylating nicotinate-nucleotide diphosphorylase [Desulfobacteraceae bacterium]
MIDYLSCSSTKKLIELALEEDIGSGDITTQSLVPRHALGQGEIVAKQDAIICGLDLARLVFKRLDKTIDFKTGYTDGQTVYAGKTVASVSGALAGLLTAERTALNFLQRLSGIATKARRHIQSLRKTSATLVDTRKTTPGWRVLEKYAVRVGGAANHRMGLYDGVLIKDNHIAACGGILNAVNLARKNLSHLIKIEVETTTIAEVREALEANADVIMLDNMDLDQIKAAVAQINKKALVEISGGITADKLAVLASTGVDLISMGALTHSASAVDLSMNIIQQTQ